MVCGSGRDTETSSVIEQLDRERGSRRSILCYRTSDSRSQWLSLMLLLNSCGRATKCHAAGTKECHSAARCASTSSHQWHSTHQLVSSACLIYFCCKRLTSYLY